MTRQYIPDMTTKLILRNRKGKYDVRVVRRGSRTGIPDDMEIIAEIPASTEYGHYEELQA